MFARLSVFLLVSLVISCCSSERPTPFIAWSDSDAFSSVRQRDTPSVADIVEQAKLDKLEILVIFRTDALSFDDIVKFSGAYGEGDSALEALQSQVSKAASSVWSGVHGSPASELVDILSEQLGMEPHYLRDWTNLPQTSGSPQLLLLDLPVAGEKEDFARQDAAIAAVMDSIEKLGRSFAAFYTAGGSKESSVPVNLRSRRQTANPAKVNSSLCWSKYEDVDTPCLLFCLPNITYQMRYIHNYSAFFHAAVPHNETLCWLNVTVDESSMVCGNSKTGVMPELELVLDFPDCKEVNEPPTDRIKLTFPHGNNNTVVDFLPKFYWRMDLSYSDSTTGEEVTFIRSHTDPRLYRTFAVPLGVAYACNSSTYNSYTINATSLAMEGFEGSVFQFLSVQVQPYNVTFTSSVGDHPFFSSTYNCEGYFTFPSLMGVFVVLLLLLILYLSTIFIFSMQTIDRFDDPRGQTINVENLH